MNEDLIQKIEENSRKIEKIYESVEKTRKYMLTAVIVMIIMFFLPLIGLIFVIPQFLKTYSSLGV